MENNATSAPLHFRVGRKPRKIAETAWDNGHVTDYQEAFFSLLMASDPWPLPEKERLVLVGAANYMSRRLGFSDWIEAFHGLSNPPNVRDQRAAKEAGHGK
jgi:hypothetical protein